MEQMARNLTDGFDGFLRQTRNLIHDRDPLYTKAFCEILRGSGVEPIKLPARSPNLNAYAERFGRSIGAIFFFARHRRFLNGGSNRLLDIFVALLCGPGSLLTSKNAQDRAHARTLSSS